VSVGSPQFDPGTWRGSTRRGPRLRLLDRNQQL